MQHPGNIWQNQENPSLSSAILAVMRIRGMSATHVAAKMESGRNRATLYRILSGSTQDPKVSTFVDICQALDVSPIEVLQLAALVPHTPRETDLLDIRMRQIFRHVQSLPDDTKRLAVTQLGAITDSLSSFASSDHSEARQVAEEPEQVPAANRS